MKSHYNCRINQLINSARKTDTTPSLYKIYENDIQTKKYKAFGMTIGQ